MDQQHLGPDQARCYTCGRVVDRLAPACPHCGRIDPTGRRKRQQSVQGLIGLAGVLVFIVVAVAIWPTDDPVVTVDGPTQPVVEQRVIDPAGFETILRERAKRLRVTATDVAAAFETNGVAARRRYGRPLTISGIVATVGVDVEGHEHVTLQGEPIDVWCAFWPGDSDRLATLHRGDAVTISTFGVVRDITVIAPRLPTH